MMALVVLLTLILSTFFVMGAQKDDEADGPEDTLKYDPIQYVAPTLSCAQALGIIQDEDYVSWLNISTRFNRFAVQFDNPMEEEARLEIMQDIEAKQSRYVINLIVEEKPYHFTTIYNNGSINHRVNESWYYSRDEIPNSYNLSNFDLVFGDFSLSSETIGIYQRQDLAENFRKTCAIKGVEMRNRVTNIVSFTFAGFDHQILILDQPLRILEITKVEHAKQNIERIIYYYGDDGLDLSVSTNYPRASRDFDLELKERNLRNGTLTQTRSISQENNIEANNTDFELRVITNLPKNSRSQNYSDARIWASMNLSEGNKNQTDSNGHYWNITWNDNDGNNLISKGDNYSVETNYTTMLGSKIVLYDKWANNYEGGPLFEDHYQISPLSGVSLGVLLPAIVVSVLVLQRRRPVNAPKQ